MLSAGTQPHTKPFCLMEERSSIAVDMCMTTRSQVISRVALLPHRKGTTARRVLRAWEGGVGNTRQEEPGNRLDDTHFTEERNNRVEGVTHVR